MLYKAQGISPLANFLVPLIFSRDAIGSYHANEAELYNVSRANVFLKKQLYGGTPFVGKRGRFEKYH